MKLARGQAKKIIAATSVAIFSLATAFLGAFAWFAAKMNSDNTSDNFEVTNLSGSALSISLHKWYGEATSNTNIWGFNPTPETIVDFEGNSSNRFVFEMEEYELLDQDHPVLFLIQVNGNHEVIKATTDCCFVASTPTEIKKTFATYASLSGTGLSSGNYVLVEQDENYDSTNKPTTLRRYNGSSFASVTYATKTALDAALAADTGHSTFTDGACFGVVSDNEHNNSTTVYKYDLASNKLSMIYFALEAEHNPLSSAVKFNSLSFTYDPKSSQTQSYSFDEYGTQTCIPVNKTTLGETVSFVTVNNNTGTSTFENEINIFNDDIEGTKFIGIVMNYNPAALEYICSYFLGNSLLEGNLGFSCDWNLAV